MFNQQNEIRGRGLQTFNQELESEITRFTEREKFEETEVAPITKAETKQTKPQFRLKAVPQTA